MRGWRGSGARGSDERDSEEREAAACDVAAWDGTDPGGRGSGDHDSWEGDSWDGGSGDRAATGSGANGFAGLPSVGSGSRMPPCVPAGSDGSFGSPTARHPAREEPTSLSLSARVCRRDTGSTFSSSPSTTW